MISDIAGVHLRSLDNISECGFSLGVGFDGANIAFLKSTYSREWQERYVAQRYLDLDPTIKFGVAGTGSITWEELRVRYPESERFFDDAARHGLIQGNTLSIHVDGQVSIVSSSGPKWTDAERRLAKAALYTLYSLHHEQTRHYSISRQAQDVLRLMCAGFKDQEIAERLGVKLETVRQRRRGAMQAVEATSTAQLISLVIKFGLI
ncbi:autoinducer binding domain-containing protein [Leisingera sp. M523]|uniref:helix-turn-helix transcriptional regulator n=1 Tax=Leisingera sp. M523 TaxID=2867013 RepID=UPI0021A86A3A|nr:autoinducer binding domain-containing protein [Leisingera sp. M523]UWQ27284.1 autoinducer binding domain-containing protein [Leisingera sp. M523]